MKTYVIMSSLLISNYKIKYVFNNNTSMHSSIKPIIGGDSFRAELSSPGKIKSHNITMNQHDEPVISSGRQIYLARPYKQNLTNFIWLYATAWRDSK